MDHLTPALDQPRLRETLLTFLNHTMPTCAQLDYRLVGTGAALLHGVSLPAADIDILVKERSSVDAFDQALSSFKRLVAPDWLAETCQYYGNYDVNGVEVGISTVEVVSDADIIETFGRGPWEHFTLLPCDCYAVPTVTLELRLITELFRNRPDRYDPLIQFMQQHGCDLDLIQRGIAAAGLSQNAQEDVISRLKGTLSAFSKPS
ncbi:MAG TPA: hypothetical protein VLG46_03870 [Anaerolineae bacterium]|nr:hypothetical protein [Anaerolineae bacterium]